MSIQLNSSQPEKSIAIGEAISEAFSPLFSNFKTAFKLTILPSLTLTFLIALALLIVPRVLMDEGNFQQNLVSNIVLGFFLVFALSAIVMCQFYTAWIRFLNKGETSIASTFIFNSRKRHFVILGKGLLLGISLNLIAGIVTLVTTGILQNNGILATVVIFVLMLFISVIGLKFSYIFPAAALDEPYGFLSSWAHTKNQGLRLFISFLILSIIFIVLMIVINIIVGLLFTILGGLFSLLSFSPEALIQAENPLEMLSSPLFLLSIIPMYFATLMLSMVSYIPFINMHNYCFQTNTGWQKDDKIADRFS